MVAAVREVAALSDLNRLRRHERTCEGKRRYDTRGAAFYALKQMVAAKGAVLGQMETYKCRACGMWHFGHKMRKGRPIR